MRKSEIERLMSETLKPLSEARSAFPGKAPDKSSLIRWIVKGVGHERLRLEGVRLGTQWFTSDEAIRRFIVARTQQGLEVTQ